MNIIFFITLFTVLSLFYLILGYYASTQNETNEDFFLAGRSLGLWTVSLTLIATQVGGGLLLGTAEQAYQTGYYGMYYSLGMAASFLILGFGLASKLRDCNVATLPELFQTRYSSPFLRKVATVLSAISLCGITASLVVSSRSLIKGLGVGSEWVTILFWVVVIAYTMMGGLKAVVWTDVFQVMLIFAVFISIFAYSLTQEPAQFFSVASLGSLSDRFESGSLNFTGFFLMPVLFGLIEQDLAQRFFAAKSKTVAAFSAIFAAVGILAFTAIPVYFGMKARLLGLAIPQGANPLIVTLRYMTNDIFISLVVCAILAAIISTADSLLCATGSLLAQDLDITFVKQRQQLLFSQGVIVATGLVAIVVGYFFDNILGLMTQSYELVVSTLFVPLIWCFVTPRQLSKTAASSSMIVGALTFFVFRLIYLPIPREIASLLVALGVYLMIDRMSRQKQLNALQ